jgi:hypothetical protein
MAFFMDANSSADRLFNVGAPDADGKGGPLEFFSMHADRTRLRWVFEKTNVEVSFTNSISTVSKSKPASVRFYTIEGLELQNRPEKGLYIECVTNADGTTGARKMIAR